MLASKLEPLAQAWATFNYCLSVLLKTIFTKKSGADRLDGLLLNPQPPCLVHQSRVLFLPKISQTQLGWQAAAYLSWDQGLVWLLSLAGWLLTSTLLYLWRLSGSPQQLMGWTSKEALFKLPCSLPCGYLSSEPPVWRGQVRRSRIDMQNSLSLGVILATHLLQACWVGRNVNSIHHSCFWKLVYHGGFSCFCFYSNTRGKTSFRGHEWKSCLQWPCYKHNQQQLATDLE